MNSETAVVILAVLILAGAVLRFFHGKRTRRHAASYREQYRIPRLSVYEAALLVRGIHHVVLLYSMSLIIKGVLAVEGTKPLRLMKLKAEAGDRGEDMFLDALDGEGRLDAVKLQHLFEWLSDQLAHKIWFQDKNLVRQYIEDAIELHCDSPGNEPLWLLLDTHYFQGQKPLHAGNGEHGEISRLLYRVLCHDCSRSSLFPGMNGTMLSGVLAR